MLAGMLASRLIDLLDAGTSPCNLCCYIVLCLRCGRLKDGKERIRELGSAKARYSLPARMATNGAHNLLSTGGRHMAQAQRMEGCAPSVAA